MGVSYNVNFLGEKTKLALNGGCFGTLNEGEFDRWDVDNEVPEDFINKVNRGEKNHGSVRFFVRVNRHWRGIEFNFWNEMQSIIDSVPWMKDIIILRPSKEIADVITVGRTADQVALALMTVRNIGQNDGFVWPYLEARRRGLTPAQAYVMSGSFWFARGLNGGVTVYRSGIGEYNNFDPHTFGRRALAQLLGPVENIVWSLGTWQSLNGYRRDAEIQEEDLFEGKRNPAGVRRFACVTQALCLDHDEKLFSFDTFSNWGTLTDADVGKPIDVFHRACDELLAFWPE
ncbi:MAG: hypothetical protein ACRDC4_05065 [Plesiomonas sp.]